MLIISIFPIVAAGFASALRYCARRKCDLPRIIYTFLMLVFITASSKADPESLLREYIDYLKVGDYDNALNCWVSEDIAASRRLGVEIIGVPLKIECATPLLPALPGIASGQVQVESSAVPINDTIVQVLVNLEFDGTSAQIPYLTVKTGKEWKLISKLTAYTHGWNTRQGEYVRVHIGDSSRYNEYAAKCLDDQIGQIGNRLGLEAEKMAHIREVKIDYYLCSEEQFQKITDYNAHGLTSFPFDAVITRHLPHPHELVHLLMNYSLGEVPLYTTPFLQEGLAVSLGGRWGKSPAVVKQVAYTIMDFEMFSLEDVLTYDDFYQKIGTPDISYPISGIFVDMLLDQIGIERFRNLYLSLSGTESSVRQMSRKDIISEIENHSGLIWDNLLRLFNEQWPRYEYSGMIPGGGGIYPIRSINMYWEFNKDYRIAINDGSYQFEVSYVDSLQRGAVLLDQDMFAETIRSSFLFDELLPGQNYSGYDYGIVFDTNEVGLYDFRTNELLAKHVESFSPGRGYRHRDPNEKMLLFSIDKNLFDDSLERYRLEIIYAPAGSSQQSDMTPD